MSVWTNQIRWLNKSDSQPRCLTEAGLFGDKARCWPGTLDGHNGGRDEYLIRWMSPQTGHIHWLRYSNVPQQTPAFLQGTEYIAGESDCFELPAAEAANWICRHGHDLPDELRQFTPSVMPAIAKNPKIKRRVQQRLPTDRQLEVLRVVGECEGNFAEAARQMSLDRKTVKQLYDAGTTNAGKLTRKLIGKPKTESLRSDSRNQVSIAGKDDGPAAIGARSRAIRDNR